MGVDSSGNKDEGAGTKELCLVTHAMKLMFNACTYTLFFYKILRLMAADRKSGKLKNIGQILKVKLQLNIKMVIANVNLQLSLALCRC